MKKSYPTSWRLNLLLSVLSLITAILILEIAIRSYGMLCGHNFFSDHLNLISKGLNPVRPFRTFGFELYKDVNGVKYISSCHGELFTVKKPKGTFRIVVFGGSTTANNYSFEKEKIHYPLIIQSELRKSLGTEAIEVINVANDSYATPHSLTLFELDVLSWEPDLIIISHNINDLLVTYWPNFTFDYSNKYSNKFYLPDYKSIFTPSNILFQHSQLYWFIRNRINNLNGNTKFEIKRKSYGIEPPQLAINVFKRNLKSFITIAKANGIKVLLGNQPLQPSEEYFISHMAYKPYNSIVTYPLHNEFVHHHTRFNEEIKKVAEETSVLFIDNDSKLGGDKEYFIDFVHYTPKGVRKLANNYANFLLSKNIIQLSDTN